LCCSSVFDHKIREPFLAAGRLSFEDRFPFLASLASYNSLFLSGCFLFLENPSVNGLFLSGRRWNLVVFPCVRRPPPLFVVSTFFLSELLWRLQLEGSPFRRFRVGVLEVLFSFFRHLREFFFFAQFQFDVFFFGPPFPLFFSRLSASFSFIAIEGFFSFFFRSDVFFFSLFLECCLLFSRDRCPLMWLHPARPVIDIPPPR